jgi:hydrogenase expression/formation protein HypC
MCLAIPGKIISIEDNPDILRQGKVDFGGIVKDINLAFVPEAAVDDYVLVHAGFAIGTIQDENDLQLLSEFHDANSE